MENEEKELEATILISRLGEFVEELRESGYHIGIGEFVKAQQLVLALLERGHTFESRHTLERMLRAVLCSNPVEQAEFGRRFQLWVDLVTRSTLSESGSIGDQQGYVHSKGKRGFQTLWAKVFLISLLCLMLILSLGVVFYSIVNLVPFEVIGFLGLILLILLGFFRVFHDNQSYGFLEHRRAVSPPKHIEHIPVQGLKNELLPAITFTKIAANFRRRIPVTTSRLDVEKSVTNAINNWGRFSPVPAVRKITPEYILLFEKDSTTDYHGRIIEVLNARLIENQVLVSAYSFKGDPRICFPSGSSGRAESLSDLSGLHSNKTLIVFGSGRHLLSPSTGGLAGWTELFKSWDDRVWITSVKEECWGETERIVSSLFALFPFTEAGLLEAGAERSDYFFRPKHPFSRKVRFLPPDLENRPQRWLSEIAPEVSRIVVMLRDLRFYLGDAGFYWLQACAVYPGLHWEVTVHLGNNLTTKENRSNDVRSRLLTLQRLLDLSSLPWFKQGFMPDWLRLALITSLGDARELEIRNLLFRMLTTSTNKTDSNSVNLPVVPPGGEISNLTIRELFGLQRRLKDSEHLDDSVFVKFMEGRKANRLALKIPSEMAMSLTKIGQVRRSSSSKPEKNQTLPTNEIIERDDSDASIVSPKKFDEIRNRGKVLLIVDHIESDLARVSSAFDQSDLTIIKAADADNAIQRVSKFDSISVMIACIPDKSGLEVFNLRDQLQMRVGQFPCAFCRRTDMSEYYSKMKDGDKLFYKPIEISVIKEFVFNAVSKVQDISAHDEELPIGTQIRDSDDLEMVKTILSTKILPDGRALNRTTDPCLFAIYLEERLNGGFSASYSEVKDCLTEFHWDLTNLSSAIDALKNKQFVKTKKFGKGKSYTSLTSIGEQEVSRAISTF